MKPFLKVIQLHKNQNELIKKASQNNREAQQALYDWHAPKMLSVCRYYIKDIHHAEEAMLNGFLKVFTQLKSFENKGSFEGWVRRIMVRESISFLRQKKQFVFAEVSEDIIEITPLSSEENLEVDDIQNLIDQLPEGYKMVFIMSAIEGYKHHEIAQILKISEGTSKSQLFKARQMLQQQLNTLHSDRYGIK
ncbi:RNA polymerase sigma factor [Formosa sediminum]|uniref:RNA polymerase sigma factor n=1 Tax=Formosa sediminum TaxID=2594004 RepID=UPI001FEAD1B4|nr:RNA polymerase sigma factor [Formosa sediminum]